MKYLKTFEKYDPDLYDPDNGYFKKLLINFLINNKPADFKVSPSFYERDEKDYAIALTNIDARKGYLYRQDKPVLTIRLLRVNDKKLRDQKTKPKLKISLKTCYDTTGIANKDFVDIFILFLCDIFKKYSYFNKVQKYAYVNYNSNKRNYEYYINTSDIDNIINNLNEFDFEAYKNMKKYNI